MPRFVQTSEDALTSNNCIPGNIVYQGKRAVQAAAKQKTARHYQECNRLAVGNNVSYALQQRNIDGIDEFKVVTNFKTFRLLFCAATASMGLATPPGSSSTLKFNSIFFENYAILV